MKKLFCVAVGIMIDIPDGDSSVCEPLKNSPLDDLVARLRREACHGRDSTASDFTTPEVTVCMTAAYQECCDQD